MKILILSNSDITLYQFRRELLAQLLQNHEVYIALPDGERVEAIVQMGCRFLPTDVDRRGISPVADLKLLRSYLKLLRWVKPDLVITYTIKPNVYGGLACRLLGVPYAANITGLGTAFQKKGALRRLVTVLHRIALRRAQTVFFENTSNRDTFLRESIVEKEQCCVLMGAGVNLAHFAPEEYPADEATIRFLFVGRVMQEKGVDELFSAMERLHAEGCHCVLDLVGFMEEDYTAAIRAGESAGWLRYHGFQWDVRPFIAASHCAVLPSYHEGMANANLECAAMARPLITSRIPGCVEAVKEDVSGYLCVPQDANHLYGEMKRFLMLTQAERAAMGRAGRQRMEALFDKKKVVAMTVERLGTCAEESAACDCPMIDAVMRIAQ